MAKAKGTAIVFADLRGGRNGVEPPLSLAGNQGAEAYNVDFWQSTLGRKRAGSSVFSLASGPTRNYWFGASRHVPGNDELAAELWAASTDYSTTEVWRYSGSWSQKTDLSGGSLNNDGWYDFCTFNSKLFMAVSRPRASAGIVPYMRVWDGTNLRTVGFAQPAAPTAANDTTGSSTTRYYKVAYTTQVTGVTTRRSELSQALLFTPTGAVGAIVTKPAALNNGETHWELYGSTAAAGPYYRIATTVVGTATYTDSADPATYSSTGTLEPTVGQNTRPSGHYYLATDGFRLLMAVPYLSTGQTLYNRVEWTPVLGTTDVGDDERCPPSNYVDIGTSDGDFITGMAKKPFHNEIYIFKRQNIYKLTPTGNVNSPYAVSQVYAGVGAVSNASIVIAEDMIYFMSDRGPYRLSVNGLEFIGANVEDVCCGTSAPSVLCSAAHYKAKAQVWFVYRPVSGTTVRLIYDIRRGGWSVWSASSLQSFIVPFTTVAYGDLIPYSFVDGVFPGTAHSIYVTDTGTTDAGTAYQAYVTTGVKAPAGLLTHASVDEPVLVAKAQTGVTISATIVKDFGLETQTFSVSITPVGSETRVIRKFEGFGSGDLTTVQVTLGDDKAVDNTWSLEAFVIPASSGEPA